MNNKHVWVGGPRDGIFGAYNSFGEPKEITNAREGNHVYRFNGKTRLIDGVEYRELEYEGEDSQRLDS